MLKAMLLVNGLDSPGNHRAFLKFCAELAFEWALRAPRCLQDAPMFCNGFKRCSVCVSVALPSRAVCEPAALIMP